MQQAKQRRGESYSLIKQLHQVTVVQVCTGGRMVIIVTIRGRKLGHFTYPFTEANVNAAV